MDASSAQRGRRGMGHGRYPFSPIGERPDFSWPGGKRLAVYVALNMEAYRFGEPLIEELVPAGPQPDIINFSWCDYGNRVAVWRLLDAFAELDFPIAGLLNSDLYAAAPQIPAAFRARGHEIVCHGRTNSERQCGLSEDEERALIGEATGAIADAEGQAPQGWLGPWISENPTTLDLLKEAGYGYVLDWCMDDQPVWMRTRAGPILSMPYSQEINDSNATAVRRMHVADFAEMILDNFDEMQRLAADGPSLVMSVALHANLAGQPFRLKHLRRAFATIAAAREVVWLARPGEAARHFARAVPAPAQTLPVA
jgi:allantoinase